MRIYEELFIVKPDIAEEELDQLVKTVEEIITSHDGTIEKTEKWGKRKLAYEVQGYTDGIYVLVIFHSGATLIRELERRLRVSDQVIKYLTVRVDEDRKRLEKKKKMRERRAARRPAPVAPAPAHAAPAIPQEEAPAAPGRPVEAGVSESAGDE